MCSAEFVLCVKVQGKVPTRCLLGCAYACAAHTAAILWRAATLFEALEQQPVLTPGSHKQPQKHACRLLFKLSCGAVACALAVAGATAS